MTDEMTNPEDRETSDGFRSRARGHDDGSFRLRPAGDKDCHLDAFDLSPRLPTLIDITASLGGDLKVELEGAHARHKAQVVLLISRVVQGKSELLIEGDPANLTGAVAACSGRGAYMVPRFVQEWRTRYDSNVRPLPSEGNALSS